MRENSPFAGDEGCIYRTVRGEKIVVYRVMYPDVAPHLPSHLCSTASIMLLMRLLT